MASPHAGFARRKSTYEERDDLKVLIGARLREARETAGMEQQEAAFKLGYKKPTTLSYIEQGHRHATHGMLTCASDIYGVSMDFLYGKVDVPDRDPVYALQTAIKNQFASRMSEIAEALVITNFQIAKAQTGVISTAGNLARCAFEVVGVMQRFRDRNPSFDDMPAGSSVLSKVSALEDAADVARNLIERSKRSIESTQRHRLRAAGIQLDIFSIEPIAQGA